MRPQVGFYHCFGCGEGGDVFTFLQRMDHVTVHRGGRAAGGPHRLRAALRRRRPGVRPRQPRPPARREPPPPRFFRAQLATPEAQVGRDFLGARGFDQAPPRSFGVGFAPKCWSTRSQATSRVAGFTDRRAHGGRPRSQGDRGIYDRFRGRLIWPIRDITGQTVGFGARKLLDDDKGPKYLNTPETAVYHKSRCSTGSTSRKRDIAKSKQVVVVEGYTDVMACHLAGVTTAVATCGTRFGVDHIKVVRRVLGDRLRRAGEVVFTFDPR